MQRQEKGGSANSRSQSYGRNRAGSGLAFTSMAVLALQHGKSRSARNVPETKFAPLASRAADAPQPECPSESSSAPPLFAASRWQRRPIGGSASARNHSRPLFQVQLMERLLLARSPQY